MKRAILVCTLIVAMSPAQARETGPTAICDTWPETDDCASGAPTCQTCHVSVPTPRNPFGADIESRLGDYLEDDGSGLDLRQRFAREVERILPDLGVVDSDGDGVGNRDELAAGTAPGDAASFPSFGNPCEDGTTNPTYNVCGYDHDYVFKRLYLDFCGHSPSYTDLVNFAALADAEKVATIAAALDAYLDSDHWMAHDGVLWRMAHAKIRPIAAIKDNDPGETLQPRGPVPLANYIHDYALFVYTQTGD